jgi:hypothetical protein
MRVMAAGLAMVVSRLFDDGRLVGDDTAGNDTSPRYLAIDEIKGIPPNHKITRINPMDQGGAAGDNDWWKGAGLASIDGILYLGIYSQSRPRPGSATKISYCAFNSSIMKRISCVQNYPIESRTTHPVQAFLHLLPTHTP